MPKPNIVAIFTSLVILNVLRSAHSAVIQKSSNSTDDFTGDEVPPRVPERVEIGHNEKHFKVIRQDTLQVIGGLSQYLTLTCGSTKNASSLVSLEYFGLEEKKMRHENILNGDHRLDILFDKAPPVARVECALTDNKTIVNSTLMYAGSGSPPYLYQHGRTVHAIVENETTVHFPCVTNYPLDTLEFQKLQIFKDGKLVEDSLSYVPELGFFLNFTNLDNPLGMYECRVANSTVDDVLTITLSNEDFIKVNYTGYWYYFYKSSPVRQPFQCTVPVSKFENRFEWHFQWMDGSFTFISNGTALDYPTDPRHYSQQMLIAFPSENISHVVCVSFETGTGKSLNNSVAVNIKVPATPKMLTGPSDIIVYKTGKNITCSAIADPYKWSWYKNGEKLSAGNTSQYSSGDVRRHTLVLQSSLDDPFVSNYTCVVTNYLGSANYTFRVQQRETPVDSPVLLYITIVSIAAVLVLGIFLMIFKIQCTPRRFNPELISQFLHGIKAGEVPFTELEPYATATYDQSREIKYKNLVFDRELKGGNFGTVHFGYLIDKIGECSRPVAIKTIKDDPSATEAEMEYAFTSFLNEIKIMQSVGFHSNVVSYVGAVTSDLANYSAYLVVEYCSQGDLDSYLKAFKSKGGLFHDDIQGTHHDLSTRSQYEDVGNTKNRWVLKSSNLMKWAQDIAAGMEYIASKKLVHMDLATRNVLLGYQGINSDEDDNPDPSRLIAKISDFGLSKNLHEAQKDYYQIVFHPEPEKSQPRKLPLRWMSLEALECLRFTTQSDVWGYGVTLWEIFTLGCIPYNEVNENGEISRPELIQYLRNDHRLPEPQLAPPELWEQMQRCWSKADRPSFRELRELIQAMNDNRINQEQHTLPQQSSSAYVALGYAENPAYNGTGDDLYDSDDDGNDEDNESDDGDGDTQYANAIN